MIANIYDQFAAEDRHNEIVRLARELEDQAAKESADDLKQMCHWLSLKLAASVVDNKKMILR